MQQFLVASSHRWEWDCAFLRLCPVVNTFRYAVICSCLRSAFFALISFNNCDYGTKCWFAFFVYQHSYATVFGRFFTPLGAGLCLFAAVSRG